MCTHVHNSVPSAAACGSSQHGTGKAPPCFDFGSSKFDFFAWPLLANAKKKRGKKISIRNAWRCRKCMRCFTVLRDTATHECKCLLRHQRTLDRIQALHQLTEQQFAADGLDQSSPTHVMKVAISALRGGASPG